MSSGKEVPFQLFVFDDGPSLSSPPITPIKPYRDNAALAAAPEAPADDVAQLIDFHSAAEAARAMPDEVIPTNRYDMQSDDFSIEEMQFDGAAAAARAMPDDVQMGEMDQCIYNSALGDTVDDISMTSSLSGNDEENEREYLARQNSSKNQVMLAELQEQYRLPVQQQQDGQTPIESPCYFALDNAEPTNTSTKTHNNALPSNYVFESSSHPANKDESNKGVRFTQKFQYYEDELQMSPEEGNDVGVGSKGPQPSSSQQRWQTQPMKYTRQTDTAARSQNGIRNSSSAPAFSQRPKPGLTAAEVTARNRANIERAAKKAKGPSGLSADSTNMHVQNKLLAIERQKKLNTPAPRPSSANNSTRKTDTASKCTIDTLTSAVSFGSVGDSQKVPNFMSNTVASLGVTATSGNTVTAKSLLTELSDSRILSLHRKSIEGSKYQELPESADKMRLMLMLPATEETRYDPAVPLITNEWQVEHKIPFCEVAFQRSDVYMVMKTQGSGNTAPSAAAELVMETNNPPLQDAIAPVCKLEEAAFIDKMSWNSSSKSLRRSTVFQTDAAKAEAGNPNTYAKNVLKTKLCRKVYDSDTEYIAKKVSKEFLKQFQLDAMVFIIDINMNIIKTLHSTAVGFQTFPGVTLNPDYLFRKHRKPNTNNDNQIALLDIDINLLPKDVFAVVPVIMDQYILPTYVGRPTSYHQATTVEAAQHLRASEDVIDMHDSGYLKPMTMNCSLFIRQDPPEEVGRNDNVTRSPIGSGSTTLRSPSPELLERHAHNTEVVDFLDSYIVPPDGPVRSNVKWTNLRSTPSLHEREWVPCPVFHHMTFSRVSSNELCRHYYQHKPSKDKQKAPKKDSGGFDIFGTESTPSASAPGSPVVGARKSSVCIEKLLLADAAKAASATFQPSVDVSKQPSPAVAGSRFKGGPATPSPASINRSARRGSFVVKQKSMEELNEEREKANAEYRRQVAEELKEKAKEEAARITAQDYEKFEPILNASNAVIGPTGSYVPYVVFRSSLSTPQNNRWAIKTVNFSTSSNTTLNLIPAIYELLAAQNILPYHAYHVEHCRDCEAHAGSTRHAPGSYEKKFLEFCQHMQVTLPYGLFYNNAKQLLKFQHSQKKEVVDAELEATSFHAISISQPLAAVAPLTPKDPYPPRLGSFEIIVKPYMNDGSGNSGSRLASSSDAFYYSKLRNKMFPNYNSEFEFNLRKMLFVQQYTQTGVRDTCWNVCPPEFHFPKNALPVLEIACINLYYKCPIDGAVVTVYKVTSKLSVKLKTNIIAYDKLLQKTTELASKASDAEKQAARVAAQMSSLSNSGPAVTVTKLTYADYLLQINPSAYFKIQTWSRDFLVSWFKSYGLNDEMILKASLGGVVDGSSLLCLTTEKKLWSWGVRNRKSLNGILSEITSIRGGIDTLVSENGAELMQTAVAAEEDTGAGGDEGSEGADSTGGEEGARGPLDADARDNMSLVEVATAHTNARGTVSVNLPAPGSYVFKIEGDASLSGTSTDYEYTSATQSYSSLVLPFYTASVIKTKLSYFAAVKPKLGRLEILIDLDENDAKRRRAALTNTGLLVAFVNIRTMFRHIMLAEPTDGTKSCWNNTQAVIDKYHLPFVSREVSPGGRATLLIKTDGHPSPLKSKLAAVKDNSDDESTATSSSSSSSSSSSNSTLSTQSSKQPSLKSSGKRSREADSHGHLSREHSGFVEGVDSKSATGTANSSPEKSHHHHHHHKTTAVSAPVSVAPLSERERRRLSSFSKNATRKESNMTALATAHQAAIMKQSIVVPGRQLRAVLWVPVGTYYSEVDGAVRHVVESNPMATTETSCVAPPPINPEAEPMRPAAQGDFAKGHFHSLKYTEHLALKCHKRIALGAVNVFQRFFRRYKTNEMQDKLFAYLIMRMRIKKYVRYIRNKLMVRALLIVQSVVRTIVALQRWKKNRKATVRVQAWLRGCRGRSVAGKVLKVKRVILVQSIARVRLARAHIRKLRQEARDLAMRTIQAYFTLARLIKRPIRRMRRRFNNAASSITLMILRYVARQCVEQKREERAAVLRLRKVTQHLKQKAVNLVIRKYERIREADRNIEMMREEMAMRKFLRLEPIFVARVKEEERKNLDKKLQEIERKEQIVVARRNWAAVLVQKMVRGYMIRLRLGKMLRGWTLLQSHYRRIKVARRVRFKFSGHVPLTRRYIAEKALKLNGEFMTLFSSRRVKQMEEARDCWPDAFGPQPDPWDIPEAEEEAAAVTIQTFYRMCRDKWSYQDLLAQMADDVSVGSVESALAFNNVHKKMSKWWRRHMLPMLNRRQAEEIGIFDYSGLTKAGKYNKFREHVARIEFTSAARIQAMTRGVLCRAHLRADRVRHMMQFGAESEGHLMHSDHRDGAGEGEGSDHGEPNQSSGDHAGDVDSVQRDKNGHKHSHGDSEGELATLPSQNLLHRLRGLGSTVAVPLLTISQQVATKTLKSASRHARVLRESIKDAAAGGLTFTGASLKGAYKGAKESSAAYIVQQVRAYGRSVRRNKCVAGMQDAMLLLSGGNVCLVPAADEEKDGAGAAGVSPNGSARFNYAANLHAKNPNHHHHEIASTLLSSAEFCPVIHRKWYLVAYPHIRPTRGAFGTAMDALGRSGRGRARSKVDDAVQYMQYGGYPDKGSRLTAECVRSPVWYPFSMEGLQRATLSLHLTDHARYDYVEYLVYMDSSYDPKIDSTSADTEVVENLGIAEMRRQYIPVFQGLCQLTTVSNKSDNNNGTEEAASASTAAGTDRHLQGDVVRLPVFPPYGGRMHLLLTPNVMEISTMARWVANQLISIAKISVLITLIPVAVPSSKYLHTFIGYKQPGGGASTSGSSSLWVNGRGDPYVFPVHAHLVDGELLEPSSIRYNHSVYGSVICATGFRNRFFVSARNNHVYSGIMEYTADGAMLTTLLDTETADTLRQNPLMSDQAKLKQLLNCGRYVTVLLSGSTHVTACMDNGTIIVFQSQGKRSDGLDGPASDPESAVGSGQIASDYEFQWKAPIFLTDYHHDGIVAGCQTTDRSNMDIFCTVDKSGFIVLTLMDHGAHVRSFVSPPVSHAKIQSVAIFDNKLYISLRTGSLCICDLTSFYQSSVLPSGTSVYKHLVPVNAGGSVGGEVFPEDVGTWSMCIMASNSITNRLYTEDDVRRQQEEVLLRTHHKKQHNTVTSSGEGTDAPMSYSSSIIEGHLLLVGGGDADPRVRILRPIYYYHQENDARNAVSNCVLHEIASLDGHSKAITQIATCASGRTIVTASPGDMSVRLWDGLTFACYHKYDHINVNQVSLAYNSLLITSFKPPYLRLYRVVYHEPISVVAARRAKAQDRAKSRKGQKLQEMISHSAEYAVDTSTVPSTHVGRNASSASIILSGHSTVPEGATAPDVQFVLHEKELQQLDIQTRRSVQWCYAVLKNTLHMSPRAQLLFAEEYDRQAPSAGAGKQSSKTTNISGKYSTHKSTQVIEDASGNYLTQMVNNMNHPNHDNPMMPQYPFTSFQSGEEYEEDVDALVELWSRIYRRCNVSEKEKLKYIGNLITLGEPNIEKKSAVTAAVNDLLATKMGPFSTPKKKVKTQTSSFLQPQAMSPAQTGVGRTARAQHKLSNAKKTYAQEKVKALECKESTLRSREEELAEKQRELEEWEAGIASSSSKKPGKYGKLRAKPGPVVPAAPPVPSAPRVGKFPNSAVDGSVHEASAAKLRHTNSDCDLRNDSDSEGNSTYDAGGFDLDSNLGELFSPSHGDKKPVDTTSRGGDFDSTDPYDLGCEDDLMKKLFSATKSQPLWRDESPSPSSSPSGPVAMAHHSRASAPSASASAPSQPELQRSDSDSVPYKEGVPVIRDARDLLRYSDDEDEEEDNRYLNREFFSNSKAEAAQRRLKASLELYDHYDYVNVEASDYMITTNPKVVAKRNINNPPKRSAGSGLAGSMGPQRTEKSLSPAGSAYNLTRNKAFDNYPASPPSQSGITASNIHISHPAGGKTVTVSKTKNSSPSKVPFSNTKSPAYVRKISDLQALYRELDD